MRKIITFSLAYLVASYAAGFAFAYEPIGAALGDEIAGQASVIDGDTLDVHGVRIRLHGVDAPESRQLCQDETGEQYRCGQQAAMALSDFIGMSPVTCQAQDTDRYGRTVAKCFVRNQDIESWLVKNGLATAYRKYSPDYVSDEAAARAARRGIWRGMFEAPSDWRHSRRHQF